MATIGYTNVEIRADYNGVDAIWFIDDILSKRAYFIPIQESYLAKKLAGIYVIDVVARYGVLVSKVFDRGVLFTSSFLEEVPWGS